MSLHVNVIVWDAMGLSRNPGKRKKDRHSEVVPRHNVCRGLPIKFEGKYGVVEYNIGKFIKY